MTRRPIRDAKGNIVGYEDDSGSGKPQRGGNVKTDANRKQNKRKPKPPPQSAASVAADAGGRQYAGPDPAVVARQRKLRAAGFPVVVDGTWGAKSQAAWNQYQRGVRPLTVGKTAKSAADLAAEKLHAAVEAAKKEAVKGVPPAGARGPIQPYGPPVPQSVIQAARRDRFAKALQYGIVRDSGQKAIDKVATRVALRKERLQAVKVAEAARSKPPEQMSLDELISLTVDPVTGNLDPQSPADVLRIQKWLNAHGHRDLKADGVFSRSTFEALKTSYTRAVRAEKLHTQTRLVNTMYRVGALHPGDAYPILGRNPSKEQVLRVLRAGGFSADLLWTYIVEQSRDRAGEFLAWREQQALRLGRAAFGPFLHPIFSGSSQQQLRAVQMAFGDRTVGELAAATSTHDLKRRLKQLEAEQTPGYADYKKLADKGLVRQMSAQEFQLSHAQQEAAHHSSWWQGAIDWTFVKPGEALRDVTVASFQQSYSVITTGGVSGNSPEDRWRMAHEWNQEFADDHFWGNLVWTLAVDPWNFVPVGRGVGLGTRASLRLEQFGYALGREGEVLTGVRALSKKGTGLALTLPARSGRGLGHVARVQKLGVAADFPRLAELGRGLTAQKQAAVSVARTRVNNLLAHHFDPAADSGVEAIDIPSDLKQAIKELSPDAELHAVNWLKVIYETFRDGRISFFANASHGVHSNPAEGVIANAAEYFRVVEVERRAVLAAQEAYQNAVLYGEKGSEIGAATDAYKDFKNRAGSYLLGARDRFIGKDIEEAVRVKLSNLRDVIFPLLQKRLVRELDELGETLFDETGRWTARGGAADDVFRQIGRDAFGDADRIIRVRNPLQGHNFDLAGAIEMQDQEIARRVGRLKGWAARRAVDGHPLSDEALSKMVQDIRDEVQGSWEQQLDGTYIDKRDDLEVLDIYARQQAELYKGVPEQDIPESVKDVIAQLPARPGEVVNSPLQVELRNLAWALGGSDELASVSPILENILPQLRPSAGYDVEKATAFHGSVKALGDKLGSSWQRAYPASLRKEYGYWRALAEAQGAWGKYTYKALSGFLQGWIFLTLPLRPGWAFRNVADNAAKIILAGVHDPRIFFLGAEHPGAGLKSFFSLGLSDIGYGIKTMDRMFGTNAYEHWQALGDAIWEMGSDVLSPILKAHNIPVPKVALDQSLFRPLDDTLRGALTARVPAIVPKAAKQDPGAFRRFQNGVWELMAQKPESYFKRVLYRDTYYKALNRELKAGVERASAERIAFDEGWKAVEKHLFDYEQETVIEENLRFVFPFVQFWRKNTMLWAEHLTTKPWLMAGLVNFEHALDEGNADLPEWTRRYINAQELGDGIAKIPGLGWLGEYVSNLDVMYDPMNYLSVAPLYRAFKGSNPLLPADKAGWKFIAPMVDAMNDWGLSMNPIVRKPLEAAGVFNYRAWQAIFPETPVVQAFTRKYLNERFPDGLNVEAILFDPLFGTATNERIAESFNEYVQLEMANQAVRGEPVDRAKAEKKVTDFFYLQTLTGFFTGAYVRRMTPEDFYLYGLAEDFHKGEANYADLSDKDKQAYRLYKFRKIDRVEFDNYVANIPLVQAYYKLGNYDQKEQFKKDNPEIVPYVEPVWAGKGLTKNYAQTAALIQDTEFLKKMSDLADDLDLPYEVKKAAEAAFITPSLQAFWDKSSTPAKQRERHLRLLYFRHIQMLNDVFHEIPATDYDAKRGFLEQHPILVHSWHQNDSASDEYLALINSANADLREAYFEHVDAEDWDSAEKFLHKYPFIFEFTKAADRVDDDGNWIAKAGHGSQHARDWKAAKWALDQYGNIPKNERSAWLHGGSKAAQVVLAYFAKYSRRRGSGHGLTEHGRDFLANKERLLKFFHMSEFDQQAWLEHDGPEQKAVLAYFKKWGSKDGHSEHARAFLKAKPSLDIYFHLPKTKRKDWLNGNSKDAKIALAFFKKWSKLNWMARLWAKMPESKNPELARRLKFWHHYFNLPPDKRPAYAIAEAENHGVFIYGPLSRKDREKRESEYLRKVYAHGASPKAAHYLYVKPLLDEWHKLKSPEDKRLFLRANPELGEYLDEFSAGLATGDKKLDKLIEGYFTLPDSSPARSEYLQKHPQVQQYFNEHTSKAQRAMLRLLDVYFKQPFGQARKDFLVAHPEIRAYFDERKRQHDLEKGTSELFASLDPRLASYRDFGKLDSYGAQLMLERETNHRRQRDRVDGITVRRDRNKK